MMIRFLCGMTDARTETKQGKHYKDKFSILRLEIHHLFITYISHVSDMQSLFPTSIIVIALVCSLLTHKCLVRQNTFLMESMCSIIERHGSTQTSI